MSRPKAKRTPQPSTKWPVKISLSTRLKRQFQGEPTLTNYYEMRRKHPRTDFLAVQYNIYSDDTAIAGELEQNTKIDFGLYERAKSGDRTSTKKLCLTLIEHILEREKARASGETQMVSRGEAIGNTLINALVMGMIDGWAHLGDETFPEDLIVLLRHQLLGLTNPYNRKAQQHTNMNDALILAAIIDAKEGSVSMRRIAKELDLEPSTVSRWFPDGTFKHMVKEKQKSKWFVELVKPNLDDSS